jgi:GNAT superfamily N-acetyltransferase
VSGPHDERPRKRIASPEAGHHFAGPKRRSRGGPVIEHLTDDNLDGCAEVLVGAFAGEPWWEPWTREFAARRLRQIHETPGSLGLLALDAAGGVAGFVLGVRETTARGETFCVQWVCVRPGSQGRGIGRTLLGELDHALDRLDVRSAYLLTARDEALETFYERCGYRRDPRYVLMQRRKT